MERQAPRATTDLQFASVMNRISQAANVAAVGDALMEAVRPIGMTVVASGMVSGPLAQSDYPFHFETWPKAWLELYRTAGFLEKDPVPRWALVSGLPVAWTELRRKLPPNDPGMEVYAAAARFGFREGYVTPVRTGDGHLGLVSIGGDRGPLRKDECHFLQVVSISALHRADALLGGAGGRAHPVFSRRERECLALLAEGATDAELAASLGVSEATIRFHLENARRKVNARSRTHLIALSLGRLNHAPPSQ